MLHSFLSIFSLSFFFLNFGSSRADFVPADFAVEMSVSQLPESQTAEYTMLREALDLGYDDVVSIIVLEINSTLSFRIATTFRDIVAVVGERRYFPVAFCVEGSVTSHESVYTVPDWDGAVAVLPNGDTELRFAFVMRKGQRTRFLHELRFHVLFSHKLLEGQDGFEGRYRSLVSSTLSGEGSSVVPRKHSVDLSVGRVLVDPLPIAQYSAGGHMIVLQPLLDALGVVQADESFPYWFAAARAVTEWSFDHDTAMRFVSDVAVDLEKFPSMLQRPFIFLHRFRMLFLPTTKRIYFVSGGGDIVVVHPLVGESVLHFLAVAPRTLPSQFDLAGLAPVFGGYVPQYEEQDIQKLVGFELECVGVTLRGDRIVRGFWHLSVFPNTSGEGVPTSLGYTYRRAW